MLALLLNEYLYYYRWETAPIYRSVGISTIFNVAGSQYTGYVLLMVLLLLLLLLFSYLPLREEGTSPALQMLMLL